MKTRIQIYFTVIVLHLVVVLPVISLPQNKSGKVILIGIDGMSTDGFQTARIPGMMELIQNGALSIKTRGVMPTVSAPNWETILTGAGPEQTGVTKNGWTVKNHTIEPEVTDKEGYFPSIFTIIREQMPRAKTALFYDWKGLAHLVNNKNINKVEFSDEMGKTFAKAIPYIVQDRPDFAFIYAGFPDEMGHKYGWGTPEYYKSIEAVDALIGRLVHAMKIEGLLDQYTFIVVTDHGGVSKGHGGETMAEIEVPWIISGPRIIKNRLISEPNELMNTSPTIASILDLKIPAEWIGRPVSSVFSGTDASLKNTLMFLPKPGVSLKSGVYIEDQSLEMDSPDDGCQVRLTFNGKHPNSKSMLYTGPILLTKTVTVKAISIKDGNKSEETTVEFVKLKGFKSIILTEPPDDKFPGKGPVSLLDGKMGSVDIHDPAWIGFEGKNIEVIIDFGADRKIKKLGLNCLTLVHDSVFLPGKVEFYKSSDGKDFTLIGTVTPKTGNEKQMNGATLLSLDFHTVKSKYIRVIGYNAGIFSHDQPGKSQKTWLFTDEIIIK